MRKQLASYLLIDHGADINGVFEDYSVLTRALESRGDQNNDALLLLIQLGADVNLPGERGDTPLHQAIRNQSEWQIEILIKAGADPIIKNNDGCSSFDIASEYPASQIMIMYHTVTHSNINRLTSLLNTIMVEKIKDATLDSEKNPLLHFLTSTTDPVRTNMIWKWVGKLSPDFNSYKYYSSGLLLKKPDVKRENITALVKALQKGELETANILFRNGATVNQMGLIAAAIESGDPNVLTYILDRGFRGSSYFQDKCLTGAEVLCNTSHYSDTNRLDLDMAHVLKLYPGPFSVFAEESAEQTALNLELKKNVETLDAAQVARALVYGANPNAVFDCDATLLYDMYTKNFRSSSCLGLLGSALRLEKDEPVAQVSRLLLLFGASIMRRYSVGDVFGRNARSGSPCRRDPENCFWGKNIRDQAFARALDHFEKLRKTPSMAESTWQETLDKTSDASQVLAMLEETALSVGISIDRLSSPVYNCLGLQRSLSYYFDVPFQPYCQKIQSQLTKPLEIP